jgi:hypothetical protein
LKRGFLHEKRKKKGHKLWRTEDPPLFVTPPNVYGAQLGRRLTLESLEARAGFLEKLKEHFQPLAARTN